MRGTATFLAFSNSEFLEDFPTVSREQAVAALERLVHGADRPARGTGPHPFGSCMPWAGEQVQAWMRAWPVL